MLRTLRLPVTAVMQASELLNIAVAQRWGARIEVVEAVTTAPLYELRVVVKELLLASRLNHTAAIEVVEVLEREPAPPPPTVTPVTTPAPTPTVTPVTELPTLFRDRELCTPVREHRTVNGIRVHDVDGDPKVVVANLTRASSVSVLPSSGVWGSYPLVCKDYYYCGFRTYVLVSCALRSCAVSINAPGNYAWAAVYSDLVEFSASISSKVESVFGSGFVVYYLNIYYRMSDGHTASFGLPIWSWFFGASTEPRSPYPVEVWTTGEVAVYNCGKGGLSELCPWRGAWHSMFSCALWDVFRWLSNALASMIPQPVKDFFALVWGMLSLVGVALAFLVNPSFLLMLFALFSMIVVLYVVHVFLEKGPAGVVEIYETLKSLVESVVDTILKFVNAVKP